MDYETILQTPPLKIVQAAGMQQRDYAAIKMLSLFSGIGGIDLAALWAGIRTIAFCEINAFCQKVLKKHWPEVPIFNDVTTLSASSLQAIGISPASISIIAGGFPCQPHSISGKRLGSNDERDLWDQNKRLISEINPRWYVGENVPGLLSNESGRFFGRVLRDLAEMGYSTGWLCFGANTT
ncbi:MAG: DNA cytosine methyltransferase, partial [Phycisphaerales bacterium]